MIAQNEVSLKTLRLILGLTALALSFYYSFKFLSVGVSGMELFSALAFVAITEATKAMYCQDIVYYSVTKQGNKTVFAVLIVIVLFLLSITATAYFLLSSPLKEMAKLNNGTEIVTQLQQAINNKQAQLDKCNPTHLSKCVNPRTEELDALQTEYSNALALNSHSSDIQANRAFWQKAAIFIGTDADSLQLYFAIVRGILLELIGLALIAQASSTQHRENDNAMRNAMRSEENQEDFEEKKQLPH